MSDHTGAATRRLGQVSIETALVLVVFFWILFGVVDFARIFYDQLNVSNLAREAARKATICQNIGTIATAVANTSVVTRPTQVAWVPSTPTVTVGQQITVRVSAVYSPITPFVGPIIGDQTVAATASMTVERPTTSC